MTAPDAAPNLPRVLLTLMKGIAWRDSDPALWQSLLEVQTSVRDYVGLLRLDLMVDEAEGYAYLRQRSADAGDEDLPRLIPRRHLSYPVSLLLALLRKKMAEADARTGEIRLVLSREEVFDMVKLFLPESGNQARLMDRVDADIKKVVDLGFLRQLADDQFEVRRILKAFVDAQWLGEMLERYHRFAGDDSNDEAVR